MHLSIDTLALRRYITFELECTCSVFRVCRDVGPCPKRVWDAGDGKCNFLSRPALLQTDA